MTPPPPYVYSSTPPPGMSTDELAERRIGALLRGARWAFVDKMRGMAPKGRRAVAVDGSEVAALDAGARAFSVSGYIDRLVYLHRFTVTVGDGVEVFARHLVMGALLELLPSSSKRLENHELAVDDYARKLPFVAGKPGDDTLGGWFDRALARVDAKIQRREDARREKGAGP